MIWVVIVSFILAFILSFGLGANDVSNAFATSIGAKVITLKSAFLIASIAELAGSVSLGGLVTDNIRLYTLNQGYLSHYEIMVGMMCSLFAVSIWLILATWWKLPVSTTHAVFSGIIGFAWVVDKKAVNWNKMISMLIAWVVAPLASGTVSVIVFSLLVYFILKKANSYEVGLFAIPLIYTVTITVNVVVIVYQFLRHNKDPSWLLLGLAIGGVTLVAMLTYLIARFYVVPWIKKKVAIKFNLIDETYPTEDVVARSVQLNKIGLDKNSQHPHQNLEAENLTSELDPEFQKESSDGKLIKESSIKSPTEQLFAFLQILSAVFTSFAHGSNDVSNSIGPLVGMFNEYRLSEGKTEITATPFIYLFLFYGAVGMIIGLYVWGSRVIETLGNNLTSMCPSRGFSIELGSALTVLIASLFGLSVSTTHCKVGSIVAVGYFSYYVLYYFGNPPSSSPSATDLLLAEKGLVQHVRSNNTPSEKILEQESFSKSSVSEKEMSEIPSLTNLPFTTDSPTTQRYSIDDEKANVNWKLCLNIVLSWICTIPFAGLLAAGFFALFRQTIS